MPRMAIQYAHTYAGSFLYRCFVIYNDGRGCRTRFQPHHWLAGAHAGSDGQLRAEAKSLQAGN